MMIFLTRLRKTEENVIEDEVIENNKADMTENKKED